MRREGRGRARNNGSTQIAKPAAVAKGVAVLHLGRGAADGTAARIYEESRTLLAEIIHLETFKSSADLYGPPNRFFYTSATPVSVTHRSARSNFPAIGAPSGSGFGVRVERRASR